MMRNGLRSIRGQILESGRYGGNADLIFLERGPFDGYKSVHGE
jgi:hypothetical protein